MNNSAIICDEVIDANAEAKSNAKLSSTTKQILMKRKQSVKRKISIFYQPFY